MAVDKKISQLASGAPAQAGDEYVVARSGANYKLTLTNIAASMPPIGATTPNTGSFTSLTNSGNLTFSSTGQRITGDMSNATESNRLAFQTSTTNGGTRVNILTNGTGTASSLDVFGVSDPTNAAVMRIRQSGSESQILASITGTGTYLPMTFYTGGSERMRLDTSGNLGIGVTPTVNLDVKNGAGNCTISAQYGTGTKGQLIAASNEMQLKAFNGTNDVMTFVTGASERMRIDSSGNVGIGRTSPSAKLDIAGDVFITKGSSPLFCTGDNQILRIGVNQTESMRITTAGEVYIAGTTDQGAYNLQCNGTGVWGAGAYVNGSDARLKDEITSLDSGLDVVAAMRPVTFRYKESHSKDQSVQPGFIAQELQTAMAGKPYLDGVVQSGPEYLNVAYQNIIPILVKAMQEQQDQIKALQDKIAALEAK